MGTLSSELVRQCREVLNECDEFQNLASLRAIFITDELRPFQAGLPIFANDSDDLVSKILDSLSKKKLNDGSYVLSLLLRMLADKRDVKDSARDTLMKLSESVQYELSQRKRSGQLFELVQVELSSSSTWKRNQAILWSIGGAIIIIFIIVFSLTKLASKIGGEVGPKSTKPPDQEPPGLIMTETPADDPTETIESASSAQLPPVVISPPSSYITRVRSEDGMIMIFVITDTFMMGSNPDFDSKAENDEFPQHEVSLDAYWIDQTEVTNAQFRLFADATGYETVAERVGTGWVHNKEVGGWDRLDGFDWQHPRGPDSDLTDLGNHPVIFVSWEDADKYCEWAGGALPTEAQWEYAARGIDGRIYPWDDIRLPSKSLLNFNLNISTTTPVGTYSPEGNSWVNARDMAGNVSEWVNDWYDSDYYYVSPADNPTGTSEGECPGRSDPCKVLRGGSWFENANEMRVANRSYGVPEQTRHDYVGFRCIVPLDN